MLGASEASPPFVHRRPPLFPTSSSSSTRGPSRPCLTSADSHFVRLRCTPSADTLPRTIRCPGAYPELIFLHSPSSASYLQFHPLLSPSLPGQGSSSRTPGLQSAHVIFLRERLRVSKYLCARNTSRARRIREGVTIPLLPGRYSFSEIHTDTGIFGSLHGSEMPIVCVRLASHPTNSFRDVVLVLISSWEKVFDRRTIPPRHLRDVFGTNNN